MKKILMLVTLLMSVLMLSACEHYFPYYGGYGDDGYSEHDDGHFDGYGGGYGGHEGGDHEGGDHD